MASDFEISDHELSITIEPVEKILPPLSENLKADKDLQLSSNNLKESFVHVLNNDETNQKSISEQLKNVSIFPAPGIFAKCSSLVYKNEGNYDKEIPSGWKLIATAFNNTTSNGYFGAAYLHAERHHVIIAHRGTDIKNFGALNSDVKGILFHKFVPQMNSCSTFADMVIQVLLELEKEKKINFAVFFTGHSLGGWLAQITTFTTCYLDIVDNCNFRKNEKKRYPHVHTVVFDSPGCEEMLTKMKKDFDVRLAGQSIKLNELDITSYLSAPNRINTCNTHVGTVYRIFIDVSGMNILARNVTYNLYTHNMDKMIEVFDEVGQVKKDSNGMVKMQTVVDWPISDGLRRGNEFKRFFEWAEHLNNYHPNVKQEEFKEITRKGFCPIRYQTIEYNPKITSLNVFTNLEKQFLETYQGLRDNKLSDFLEFFDKETSIETKKEVRDKLENYVVENNNFRCTTTADELNILIPFIKRLVNYFFTEDKQKKTAAQIMAAKKLYHFMTKDYLQKLEKESVDFNSNAIEIESFINNDNYNMWLLQVKEKTWVAIKKIYRALQKMKLYPDSQVTVLELKQLVVIDGLLKFETILDSVDRHLLVMDCNMENGDFSSSKSFFAELFDTWDKNRSLKVITVIQENHNPSNIFQEKSLNSCDMKCLTNVDQIIWSDLTTESQQFLLLKPVKFQGKSIFLNQLIKDDDKDVLQKLLPWLIFEKGPITVGTSLPMSTEYNSSHYIPRVFNRQNVIRKSLLENDKTETFPDILAETEKEFMDACQKYPRRNVHWLTFTKNMVWQKSQGTLSNLRPMIDTKKITQVEEKELRNSNSQNLIIISDLPGMGKTTLLDHISRCIKEDSPYIWVVRLNLYDYSDQFPKDMESFFRNRSIENVIEFLSADILNLTSFEKHIFNHVIQKTGQLYFLLDGFDEITVNQEKSFLALIKRLQKVTLGKTWITTRPNKRDLLENEFLQFSYSLKPFAENDQINFLTKFWQYELRFGNVNTKKLRAYSESLVKKIVTLIKDNGRRLTGIPLQSKMLAEIYQNHAQDVCINQLSHTVPETFSLIELYKKFVDKKFEIFGTMKLNLKFEVKFVYEWFKCNVQRLKFEHQILALHTLFTPEQVNFLVPLSVNQSNDHDELTAIGMVVTQGKNTDFVHRNFAEYFAADFIVSQLLCRQNPVKQGTEFLMEVVLVDGQYETLRAFINTLLEELQICDVVIDKHTQYIAERWRENNFNEKGKDTAWHVAYQNGLSSIINFLNASVRDHLDILKSIYLFQNYKHLTILHYATISGGIKTVMEVFDILKEKNEMETIRQILFQKDGMGKNSLHLAMQKNKSDVANELLDYVNSQFGIDILRMVVTEKDNDGRTPLHWTMMENHLKTATWLLDYITDNVDIETARKLVIEKDNDGRNAVYWAFVQGNSKSAKGLLQYVIKNFDPQTTNQLVFGKDTVGRHALHYTLILDNLEAAKSLLDYIEEQFESKKVMYNILFDRDDFGHTALHWSLIIGNSAAAIGLLEYTKNKFEKAIMKDLLICTDNDGRTAIHRGITQHKLLQSIDLLQYVSDHFKMETVNRMLTCKDNYGSNAIQLAMLNNEIKSLEEFMDGIKNTFGDSTLKAMLSDRSGDGYNAFHFAMVNGKSFLGLLDYIKRNFGTHTLKEMVFSKDNTGRNAIHGAMLHNKVSGAIKLLKYLKNKIDIDTARAMAFETDNNGNNAITLPIIQNNLTPVIKLLKHIKKVFGLHDVMKIILKVNCVGMNAVEYAKSQKPVIKQREQPETGKKLLNNAVQDRYRKMPTDFMTALKISVEDSNMISELLDEPDTVQQPGAKSPTKPSVKTIVKMIGKGVKVFSRDMAYILKKVGPRKLIFLSICGKMRTGKSFILSLIIDYLNSGRSQHWITEFLNDPNKSFKWRKGVDPETRGVNIWSEPIILDGGEIAVVLMDCQGAFDLKTSSHQNSLVFALAALLSSVFIYNVKDGITEEAIQPFLVFMNTAMRAGGQGGSNNRNSKVLQKLLILSRDVDEDDYKAGYYSAAKTPNGSRRDLYKETFLPVNASNETIQSRKHILSNFEEVGVYAMCHPGDALARRGDPSNLDIDFVTSATAFMNLLFSPQNLLNNCKSVHSQPITGDGCLILFKSLAEKFNKNQLPPLHSLFANVAEAQNNLVKGRALEKYNTNMERDLSTAENGIPHSEIEELHALHNTDCLLYFKEQFLFGGWELKNLIEERLKTEIQESYGIFWQNNEHKLEVKIAANKLLEEEKLREEAIANEQIALEQVEETKKEKELMKAAMVNQAEVAVQLAEHQFEFAKHKRSLIYPEHYMYNETTFTKHRTSVLGINASPRYVPQTVRKLNQGQYDTAIAVADADIKEAESRLNVAKEQLQIEKAA